MKSVSFRHILFAAAMALTSPAFFPCSWAIAQSGGNWAADDSDIEARKIERYQQLVDQSPDKSYAFNQLMASVGKGAEYQKLLADYEKKVASKPQNFNLRMILGHMYQYGGRSHEAIQSYKKALDIKKTPLAYISIAAAEAENRNFEEAASAYDAAAALNPSKEQKQEIWRAQAEIALYRRDLERAKTCFAELIKIEPNSLFVRRELSQIYAQNRMYDEARSVLQDASKLSSVSSADREQIELDIAQLYEQEGRDDEALAGYEALSQKLGAGHWMQRELTSHIIDIHRRRGSVPELIDALTKAWKSPTYEQHLELADLYEETSKPDDALNHLKKPVSMAPKRPEAREKLVAFYRSHGMISQMFEAKNDLIKANPDNPEYRFDLYEDYIQQKQIDKAMAVLDETAKKYPNDYDTQRRIAEAFQMHGHTNKALAIYESWVKKHPNDIESLEALGDIYDGLGQRQKALASWQKIEKLPMDKATKLETLARIYDEHGYAEESESLYAKALAANPKDCQAHAQYADVLTRNGKQYQALKAWETLVKTCPADPIRTTAAKRMASIYQARGAQKRTIQQFKGRAEEHPEDLNHTLFFAKLAIALEQPKEAIPALQRYVESNPSQTEALQALNELQVNAGDLSQARETLQKLAAISETDKRDALLAMVDIDMAQGDLDSARDHLEQALKLNANDADTHERLGDVLLKMRLYQEAANNYETAFQIDSRNYSLAFKHATCLSILAKDKEADDIYIKIVSESTDEALALKAAQRVIDDMTWRGELDTLTKAFMPLLRSNQRKTLYLDILLQVAGAKAQPLILAIQTRDPAKSYEARHALRELSDTYAQVMVEGIMSKDGSISARALELSEWLASASVVSVLGQKIEQSPANETGRMAQLQAIRAIAHAQLPASVPILKNCLSAHYSRALREHAVWALGLISASSAMDELKNVLDSSLDSFRALAVIGLGRHGAYLDDIQKLLTADPSPLVKNSAAWMLAFHHIDSAKKDILTQIGSNQLKPHQLWALAAIDPDGSASKILESRWAGTEASRQMADKLIQSHISKIDLSQLTQPEAVGAFIKGDTTHYMSNFDIDLLLENFAKLSLSESNDNSAWLDAHKDDVIRVAADLAVGRISPADAQDSQNNMRIRMLRDLIRDYPKHQQTVSQALASIEPQLSVWSGDKIEELAGLSLQSLSLTHNESNISKLAQIAQNDSSLPKRMHAIQALGAVESPAARQILCTLSKDKHYLIRATAVSQLDPGRPDENQILQNAQKDEFAAVSQAAAEKLGVR